ncbi:hypothetical protein TNCV_2756311 [Trichonephila clavipes]|nr:hypothetical protein TNCV_2756311 [Trichonephila clavipes]
MGRRNHLDDITCGSMIGKLEEGRSLTSVAEEFGINRRDIWAAWKASQIIGTAIRKFAGGRSRKTNAMDN